MFYQNKKGLNGTKKLSHATVALTMLGAYRATTTITYNKCDSA